MESLFVSYAAEGMLLPLMSRLGADGSGSAQARADRAVIFRTDERMYMYARV